VAHKRDVSSNVERDFVKVLVGGSSPSRPSYTLQAMVAKRTPNPQDSVRFVGGVQLVR
jgi:hypothetical protein